MLLLASYDIVFQEVPDEVTLALNLSACPNNCPGCHSPHLREAKGEDLDDGLLAGLLSRYGCAVSCVAFMGGDGDPAEVNRLAALVHGWNGAAPSVEAATEVPATPRSANEGSAALKTAWYSGRAELSEAIDLANLDFVKLGPYDPVRGGLENPGTNQRFYRIEAADDGAGRKMVDATARFRKKSLI